MVGFEVWVGKGTERSTRFHGLGDNYKWIRIYLITILLLIRIEYLQLWYLRRNNSFIETAAGCLN